MNCRKTILIGSGKGGVGKSTIAANLAIALAEKGLKVGLLDADVYGPSIPVMFGLRTLCPRVSRDQGGKERVIPFFKFGVQVVSIGFFVEEARSLAWRGPMLHGMLQKMLSDCVWGELDLLLVDLPPGTGDVPISLKQQISPHGAIIVTTPQEVAVLDAAKAINLYHQLEIPLIGVIENMAGFKPPGSEILYPIFGEGKAKSLAEKFQIPLIGSIPLMMEIRIGADEGRPIACSGAHHGAARAIYETANFIKEIL